MRTEQEIKDGLERSEKMFEKFFGSLQSPLELKEEEGSFIKSLSKIIVATEICTLKWALGGSKLNCDNEERFGKIISGEHHDITRDVIWFDKETE